MYLSYNISITSSLSLRNSRQQNPWSEFARHELPELFPPPSARRVARHRLRNLPIGHFEWMASSSLDRPNSFDVKFLGKFPKKRKNVFYVPGKHFWVNSNNKLLQSHLRCNGVLNVGDKVTRRTKCSTATTCTCILSGDVSLTLTRRDGHYLAWLRGTLES